MTAAERGRRRRAARLLRWYPREWRSRYGAEFSELLVAEMEESPRSPRRFVDIACSGLLARLARTGLAGRTLEPHQEGRQALLTLGAVSWIFLVLAVSVWAQLTIGWQWSEPDALATASGMVVMTIGVGLFALLCLAYFAPILWATFAAVIGGRSRSVVGPLLIATGALGIMVVGTHHFANGWPGTGGHAWGHQGIVPGGVAAYAWASTLFVTSYWLHPAALQHFPPFEVAWMAISPLAFVGAVWGSMTIVARLDLSPGLVRFQKRVAVLLAATMSLFLLGASLWIVDGGPGPKNLFHTGALDFVELIALALLVAVAARAAARSSAVQLRPA